MSICSSIQNFFCCNKYTNKAEFRRETIELDMAPEFRGRYISSDMDDAKNAADAANTTQHLQGIARGYLASKEAKLRISEENAAKASVCEQLFRHRHFMTILRLGSFLGALNLVGVSSKNQTTLLTTAEIVRRIYNKVSEYRIKNDPRTPAVDKRILDLEERNKEYIRSLT